MSHHKTEHNTAQSTRLKAKKGMGVLGDMSYSELMEKDCKSSLASDKSIPSLFLPFRRAHTLFPRENVSSVRGTAVMSDKTVSWWRDNSKGLGTQTGRQFGFFQRTRTHGTLRGLWVAFLCGFSLQNHTHTETLTHTNTEQSIHQPPSSPPQIIRHVKSTKNFFFLAFLKNLFPVVETDFPKPT